MSTPEGSKERFLPSVENMGKNCRYWDLNGRFAGCNFPKAGLEGRVSCEGMIDDLCLRILRGGGATNLTPEQIMDIKTNPPSGRNLPPGDIK